MFPHYFYRVVCIFICTHTPGDFLCCSLGWLVPMLYVIKQYDIKYTFQRIMLNLICLFGLTQFVNLHVQTFASEI